MIWLVSLWGCGGDTEYREGEVGRVVGVDGASQPARHLLIIPLHDISVPMNVEVGHEVQVFVRVFDLDTDAPAEEASLSLELKQTVPDPEADPEADPGDASLSAKLVITDAQGLATVIFRAGNTPLMLYNLNFQTPGALSVGMEVFVEDIPRGNLKIQFDYEGPVDLNGVSVGIVAAGDSCTNFHAENPPESDLGFKTVLMGESTEYKALSSYGSYMVFATAVADVEGGGKHLAAGGCIDGVLVQAGATNTVTLAIHVLPLKLAGHYEIHGKFDFTNVAVDFLNEQGMAGQILADVVVFFNGDPAQVIFKYASEAAKQFLPAALVDLAVDILESLFKDTINDWLLNIPGLQGFWQVGADVTGVVSNLELISLFSFSKVYSDYTLVGLEQFVGLSLYWKLGCDPAAPDYEDCGKYTYQFQDFNNPDFPLDTISSHFTASILNWNQLAIDPHVVQLNYGKLILFALNHIVLPAIANGATNLADAFQELVSCQGMEVAGISLEGACEAATNLVSLFIESTLFGLNWDSNLTVQGTCTILDDKDDHPANDDLVIEDIIDGQYTGSVVLGGSKTSPFTATFEGWRYEGP
jgi:hypothetical protein